jgi:protein tyrosine phosphatase (PTP) superfamily phosphohydrolase (DUF442 family)
MPGPARGDRWRRPLTGRRDRLLAWLDMLLADHGLLRLIHPNLHRVAEGVWRAGQPTPGQIRAFARRGGRSVVSLRAGRAFGSLPLELDACQAAGLAWHNLVIRSRGLPSREEFRAIAEFFRTVERPVLFHCKSGADRTGFAAALWLMLREGRPAAQAKRQLALGYGHVRLSKTGVLDAFFDAYERDTRNTPMSLADWVETRYDPARILAGFRATPLGALIGDLLPRRRD